MKCKDCPFSLTCTAGRSLPLLETGGVSGSKEWYLCATCEVLALPTCYAIVTCIKGDQTSATTLTEVLPPTGVYETPYTSFVFHCERRTLKTLRANPQVVANVRATDTGARPVDDNWFTTPDPVAPNKRIRINTCPACGPWHACYKTKSFDCPEDDAASLFFSYLNTSR